MKPVLLGLFNLALIAIVLNDSIKNTAAVSPHPEAKINYRIPSNIIPSHYNLSFRPFLLNGDGNKRFTFDGEAYIDIETTDSNLKAIILHTYKLNYTIRELYETATPQTKLQIIKFHEDPATDIFTLTLAAALKPKTNYTLHFIYTGLMEDDMEGFYRSSYVDSKNNTRWLGSTHFQTRNARRAFPCFDEPKFKATFDVAITRFRSFKTISNTRLIKSQRIDKNYYKDVFATTPRMSTYLLSFIVSDFNERTDVDGEFYVVARPEYYSQTEYAFDVGRKLLAEFDKYTKVPFYETGIDKMHLAAIPDFSAGAMENWGLLTYRERALLYDEGSTNLYAKQIIAVIIAHEQAHMWFGNLVTCDWWGYTWLNEGFATYFQFFMAAEVHPEMEIEKQFVVHNNQHVFRLDSTNQTNPLSDITVESPYDIGRMFNSISYNKGGSVIRMIKHALGDEQLFKKSLQEYLNEFKYTNTVPKNIFDHWQANWHPITKRYAQGVFNSFTEQVGYPVIYIEVSNDGRSMTIEQKRFLLNPGDGSDSSLLYTVPLTYTTNLEKDFNSTFPHLYLEAKTDKVTVNFQQAIKWVMGNIQETGYYRVNYNTAIWHQIYHALRSENWDGIHELNRAQYVDDLLALARSGEVSYELPLMCLSYLETETNYLPWKSAFNGFEYLLIQLGMDKDDLAHYIKTISKKAYNVLGFVESKADKPLDIYARSMIISWNCKFGHDDCIAKSLKLYRNRHNKAIPVNIRAEVYCTAMRDGTEADFESLYQDMKTELVSSHQVLIMNNLGCVRDKRLVERFFNIVLSDDIRRQDKPRALKTLYTENAENVSPVFDLVIENFEVFKNSIGSNSSVAQEISNIAARFTTKEQQYKLDALISASGSQLGSSRKTLTKTAQIVKANLEWSDKRLAHVVKYLKGFRNSATSIGIRTLTVALVAFIFCMLK